MQDKKTQLALDMGQQTGSKLWKEYVKAVYCHPAYLYTEYIMWNAELNGSQAGIKIAGININNLRYADDTTLMAESEHELMSLLNKVKEDSGISWLKTQHSKTSPITSWQIDGENVETVSDFIFLGSKITVDGYCSHEIKRHLLLGRTAMTDLAYKKAETSLC